MTEVQRLRKKDTNVSDSSKYRINVNLSAEAYQTIQDLATSDMSMSQFVRNALRVYSTLLQEVRDGKQIYIGTDGEIEKELLVPW